MTKDDKAIKNDDAKCCVRTTETEALAECLPVKQSGCSSEQDTAFCSISNFNPHDNHLSNFDFNVNEWAGNCQCPIFV
jgi:hypothetical protein